MYLRKQWEMSQVLGPGTHMGSLEETPVSWLQIGPAQAIVAIWGVNQWMEDLFFCLCVSRSLSLTLPFKVNLNKMGTHTANYFVTCLYS